MTKSWAERIAALEGLGWSLTEIGEVIELSPQGVSDIKCGRTKEPRGMSAVRLYRLSEGDLPLPPGMRVPGAADAAAGAR